MQCLIAKTTTVLQHAPLVQDLVCEKFVTGLIPGLFKSRNVQLHEVTQYLNDGVYLASNETCTQDVSEQQR